MGEHEYEDTIVDYVTRMNNIEKEEEIVDEGNDKNNTSHENDTRAIPFVPKRCNSQYVCKNAGNGNEPQVGWYKIRIYFDRRKYT